MSSDVPERPRKTLTLPERSTPQRSTDPQRRVRSGARAHAVARAQAAAPQDAPDTRAPRRDDPRAPRRDASSAPRRDASSAPRRDGASAPRRDSASAPRRDGSFSTRRDGSAAPGRDSAFMQRGDGQPSQRRDEGASRRRDDSPSARRDGPRLQRGEPAYPQSQRAARAPDVQIASQHALSQEIEQFKVFAPCPQGLEEALTAEMQALGFADAKPGRAGCTFGADWKGIQHANLYSRLATRILVQVAQAPMQADDDVLDLARATPWERWFGPEHTLRVDTSAIRSPVKSLQYCNLRVKDGICDRLRDLEGERPSIDTVRPDARVHLFLFEQTATLYLDTSGESLFKRGWRLDKGEAPLRENLAAGILALAGWDPEQALLDPFCGSGTLLIEAAWIALGIPPGIARPLGFERLRGHDAAAWEQVKEAAYARIAPGLDAPIVGYDIDPAAIEFARNNAKRAWLAEDAIRFEVRDARQAERIAESGWIVTNPPYGDRLDNADPQLWQDWSGTLKREFADWHLHAITSDMGFAQQLRLKPKRRIPLYNGGIECRLFGFDLAAAGFRDR